MAITRAQMARQLEPGLGSSDKRKFDKVIAKTHGKVYKEKKPGRKNPLAKPFTV
jgi:hypothetical protein